LEIDFFNTVCGIFSIIGLGIAIYQLADLRSAQEIREETRRERDIVNFRQHYRSDLQDAWIPTRFKVSGKIVMLV
jgi:hypothetical protein